MSLTLHMKVMNDINLINICLNDILWFFLKSWINQLVETNISEAISLITFIWRVGDIIELRNIARSNCFLDEGIPDYGRWKTSQSITRICQGIWRLHWWSQILNKIKQFKKNKNKLIKGSQMFLYNLCCVA